MLAPRQRRATSGPSTGDTEAVDSSSEMSSEGDKESDLETVYLKCSGGGAVFVLGNTDIVKSGPADLESIARLFGSPAGRALVHARVPAQPGQGAGQYVHHQQQQQARRAHAQERPRPIAPTTPAASASISASVAASCHHEEQEAQLMGPPCSMSDSCRCLECQSRYLESVDDDAASNAQLCTVQ